MKLPALPKLRAHKEADITPDVMKWFMDNYPKDVAVEVKIKGGRMRKHQPAALRKVHDGRFDYKIPDTGRRNPFDFIILKDAHAFIVVADGRNCTAYSHDMVERFRFVV